MKIMMRTVLSLGMVALIAAPAAAQGRGFGFGRGGSYAGLLGNASVQKELKLDDQQVEKAKELSEKAGAEMREKFQDLQGLEGEERRTKMMEINRESNASTIKAAGEFLKPEQIARLKQIRHQVQGAMAFSDPEVAQKLNLTDAQKKEIQEIEQAAREKMPSREDFQSDREAAMKKAAEVNKETLSQVVAKLNDEQQKTWKELTGAPFEIKYEPRPN
jgi:Spy/CpxP family protein refolding chaperone